MISPQPNFFDMYQQASCMKTTIRIPGSIPPMNRSLIDRFNKKP